jgi:hypothetical protein
MTKERGADTQDSDVCFLFGFGGILSWWSRAEQTATTGRGFVPRFQELYAVRVPLKRRQRGERGAAAIDGSLLILLCQMHARLALARIVVLPGDSSVTVMSTVIDLPASER